MTPRDQPTVDFLRRVAVCVGFVMERQSSADAAKADILRCADAWEKAEALVKLTEREAITFRERLHEAEARVKELEASMASHFQREHLEGDGPEIDRWRLRVAELEAALAEEHGEREMNARGIEEGQRREAALEAKLARHCACDWPDATGPASHCDYHRQEVAKLREAEFVPGEWRCPKCRFVALKAIFNAESGNVATDSAAKFERCPNGCGLALERLTWAQDRRDASDAMSKWADSAEFERALADRLAAALEITLSSWPSDYSDEPIERCRAALAAYDAARVKEPPAPREVVASLGISEALYRAKSGKEE